MAQRSIIVTGAAGFIGSHAAQALAKAGVRIMGIDSYCDYYDRSWKAVVLHGTAVMIKCDLVRGFASVTLEGGEVEPRPIALPFCCSGVHLFIATPSAALENGLGRTIKGNSDGGLI